MSTARERAVGISHTALYLMMMALKSRHSENDKSNCPFVRPEVSFPNSVVSAVDEERVQ